MRLLTQFNIATRRFFGSAGPVSPGRAIVTGAGAYAVIRFGVPKVQQWRGREVVGMSGTVTVGAIAATILFVEGVCYFAGQDLDVHADATVAAFKAAAEDYLAKQERLDALVKSSGMERDQVEVLLQALKNVTPAKAEAEEIGRAHV